MNAVVAVNYFDESKGFWRFGYLEKADRKWAWVRPVVGTDGARSRRPDERG